MHLLTRLLDELFPVPCPSCHGAGHHRGPCPRCIATLVPPPSLPTPLGVRRCMAVVAYDGAARHVVLACKRNGMRTLARTMGDAIAHVVAEHGTADLDAVTWVPTSRDRIRQRGYDHAAEIATVVARHLDLPCRSLLARTSPPMDHAGAPTHQVSFRPVRAAPRGVLLIDDVRTTGRSLRAGAAALRDAGADVIDAATYAATGLSPAPHLESLRPAEPDRRTERRNMSRQPEGPQV